MAVAQKLVIQLYIFSPHFLLLCLVNGFVTATKFFSLGNTVYFHPPFVAA